MSSLAFQKFKSLDRRSQSVTRMGDKNRPSPDQGLGSSVSSSNTSLQLLQNNLKNEEQQDNSKPSMAKLREKFFTEKIQKPEQEEQKDESSENQVLDRRKSLDNNQTKKIDNNKIDALNNTQDIKSMFEQNIAVKKGLIPDPASQNKGPVVKMRRKVNPNLPNIFAKNEDEESKKRNHRESVPIDRKMFNHFLNKFEDDQSRAVGKSQLWHLTQKQKDYLSKEKSMSWSKKQEEKRLEEERKIFEEQQAKEIEEQRLREEVERLEKETREAEERKKLEEEEQEALKKAQEAEDKKKKKKKVKKTKQSEAKELPNLVANTCSDLRRKFQESLKVSNDVEKKPTQLERPRPARKLIQNPFEKQQNNGNNEVASVKRREVPAPKENRLGDIKKRFSQLITSSDPIPVPLSKNKSAANISGNNGDEPDLNHDDVQINDASGTHNNNESSPAVNKRVGLVKSSMEALKGSFEKLTNSKEKLGGAFASKKSKKPSVADMQSYLISHVLYDGTDKVQMEATPADKKEDNLFDFLEEEAEIPEEELMNDEAIKRMKSLLVFLDEDKKSSSSKKKKKKKKKVEEPTSPLKLQQVGSIKEQFEIARKQNQMGMSYQKDASEAINLEPTVGKVKTLFEQPKPKEQKQNLPIRRQAKLISNELIQKFDCPEMADELKKQREMDREERKKERLRRLEEERQKIEAERRRAQKLEEEKLEKARQERLKREEEERLQREREEEEKRIQIAYEKMVEEEKRKAEIRSEHEKEQKAKREKSEPAFRQKKVLGRIQHIFQKKMDEESPPSPKQFQIGSVKGMGEGLFAKKDEANKPLLDPSLAGVGGVLNSVKNKFEVKEEAPVPISKGVSIKKKEIPAALAFAHKDKEPEVTSPKLQTTDWSWKKKDKAQLAAELNKPDGDSAQKKVSSKALRAKKSEDRQRELLADIHAMNDRLAKKNALKEHEAKMEEYSKFMDEIQNYLTEPDQSTEESTFKDDIKTFITSKLTTKKQKKTPPVQAPKKPEPEPVSSSVSKIKEQLLQSNDTTDARLFDPSIVNTGKVDILKSSIIQQYTSEDKTPKPQEIETTNSVSAMKGMFEVENEDEASLERVKVKRKIIEMPIPKEEEQQTRKTSYEWQYKKKSIQDLQNFISTNQNFVSDNINKAVEDVGDLLEEAVTKEAEIDDAMIDAEVEGYTKMKNEVEDYLNAPDRCKEEIEFKEQIEKYLDLVEMPSKEKEHVDTSTLGRKPKKLNLSLYIKNSESEEIKDVETSPLYAKSKESASIKDLQNKLFVENRSSKDVSKEVIVHNSGTDSLKRGFEKLKKEDKVELITAPKVAPQKFFSDFINEAASSGAKSLDQLKSDGKETTWRWKQKAIGDLHTYMTGHLTKASKAVVESHKNMLKADIELQKAQSSKVKPDNEHILKITKERDEEMDNFLQNVKDYLDEPNASNKADPIKTGIQSYLSLIEEGTKDQLTLDKGVSKKFLPSGQVCGVKEQLENQSSNTIPKQSKPTIGKIKTKGLSVNDVESNSLKRSAGHSSNSHNAEDIKDHLVKKFFNNQESKDSLMKAPKTRLVQQPKSEPESKPIKPKKEWKPPTKNEQSFDPLPKPEFFKWKEEEKKAKEKEQYVSKYAHIKDEEEKKAAILAQFGCKPRPAKEIVESSSSSSSEDEEDMTNYIENDLMKNNDLYVIYGDRLKASSPPGQKKKQLKKQTDSVECLKGILGQLRRGPSRNDLDSDSDDLSLSQSPEKSYIPGSCSNIRARFENDSSPNNHNQQRRVIEKSCSFSNVGRLYEQSMEEKTDVQNNVQFVPPVGKLNRSSFHYGPVGGIPRAFLPNKGLAKSASFHKLKHSFEAGQFDESDSEDDDEDVVKGNNDQRTQIECELEEIRSSTRVQKMFSINKPKYSSSLERSSSSSAIPDHAKFPADENLTSVSEARNSIKNIFEASASKVTYGGGKSLTEQLREKEETPEPQPAKKKVQFSDRTWVLNTINKYFDVIEEDEDEEGDYDYDEDYYNEEDEDENYSDEDDDEEEEDDQVFATQVSAQRVVYGALPQHLPPKAPQFIQQQEEVYESEEEYEEEIELEEESDEEEVIASQPLSTSLLQKSASSSRIRGLFQSVLQKSDSGTDRDVSNFKANLTRHLKRRESFNSNTNLANIQREYRSDSESDDDDFEDCPEDPVETNKFYRIPL